MTGTRVDLIFFALWVTGVAVGMAFSHFNRNAALKRRLLLPFQIVMMLLFITFVWTSGTPPGSLIAVIPMVLILYAVNRTTRFCDACGGTVQGSNSLVPPKFCPTCGASLA